MTDTIFAPATPPGKSGVAMVRVSGPGAWSSAEILGAGKLQARHSKLATLKNPASHETIDRALVLPFNAPASYTGEDIVEYHVHGGRAVVDSLLAALATQKKHRLAEPGEFTRRAFENGKLDLTEAEAIADLINAETQAQKKQALAQMEGALSRLYAGWAETLKRSLAHLEADIEFPDEDMPAGILPEILPFIDSLRREITAHLDDNRRGERLRDGIHVAVIGAPNAGKSSLVNALSQRDVAIVADLPGTTRDVIEVHLDVADYPVILSDTAGLRPSQINASGHDAIESEGIRRALKCAQEADIKILLFDADDQPDEATLALADENAMIVFNKIDKGAPRKLPGIMESHSRVFISAQTGEGMDALLTALAAKIKSRIGVSEAPSLTRARHRAALEDAQTCLARARAASLPELVAEDLRLAMRAIGRITGRVDVEDLLDVIFRDFCIGK